MVVSLTNQKRAATSSSLRSVEEVEEEKPVAKQDGCEQGSNPGQ
eukprot:CAMPEP_0194567558 /NCGR_PEP_ID=MMETSP0292-20121207/5983_1 /TAXON_ID=39354 /ORGANISM="Heterosigma akashiwo, Strain CCMP2393" /LENGTH=43 /DNA_ID= /DNA_START= /DNA_END= /DNA_ORIENTATION=